MDISLPIHIGKIQITRKQYGILCQLRDALQSQQSPMLIPIHNKRDENTLALLQRRDWIIGSWKLFNEPRYAITSRGLKALAIAEKPRAYRRANLPCAECGNAPRHVYPSGVRISTCLACHNAYNRAHRATHGPVYRSDRPCSCGKPRAVSASGVVYGHCQDCRRAQCHQSQIRRAQRMQEAIATGNIPLCKRCGKAPIHISPSAAHTGCKDCTNRASRQSKKRTKIRRMAEKMGLRKS
jgi:hypothetical protein